MAAMPPAEYSGPITDESVWTDLRAKHTSDYARAKTLAESDAWEFARQQGGAMTLTTILPGMVQGPVLGRDFVGSTEVITRMLTGKVPRYPRIGWSTVDVRDLADLHVRAMESEAAAGERFIGTGDFLWMEKTADILREHFGVRAAKAPTRALPDWVVRALAPLSADLRFLVPSLGNRLEFDAGKAARVLGWRPRPAAEAVLATAESFLQGGPA